MKKFLSLFIIFILTLQQGSSAVSFVEQYDTKPAASITVSSETLHIPNGSITEQYKHPGADRELFIIIDAHNNLSAQYNISAIIDAIVSKKEIYKIYTEGASGSLEPCQAFALSDNQSINKSVADYLLRKGFITGAEYFCITTKQHPPFSGAEQPDYYFNNLHSLKDLKNINTESALTRLINYTTSVLYRSLPIYMQQLDRQYLSILLHEPDLYSFVDEAYSVFGSQITLHSDEYPALFSMYYIANETQQAVQYALASLEKLHISVTDQTLENDIVHLKRQLILDDDHSDSLQQACRILLKYRHVIDQEAAAHLAKYQFALTNIDTRTSSALFVAILDEYNRLCHTQNMEHTLFNVRNQLIGLLKGSTIRLSPEEYRFFAINTMRTDEILDTVIHYSDSDDTFLADFPASAWEQIESTLIKTCVFYDAVERRNTAIIDSITADMPATSAGILVVGGYHKNISSLLSRFGMNVTVIMPHLDAQSQHARNVEYTDYLSGALSKLEQMLYYSWSTILAPLTSQSIQQLQTRSEAIPTVVARQTALITTAMLSMYSSLQEFDPSAEMLSRINAFFARFAPVHSAMSGAFAQLDGSEQIPQWPSLNEFVPIAEDNGIYATFSIGKRYIGVQLVKKNAVIDVGEKLRFDQIISGEIIEDEIIFNNETYTFSLFEVSGLYQHTAIAPQKHYEALLQQAQGQWIDRPTLSEPQIRLFTDRVKKNSFNTTMTAHFSEFAKSLRGSMHIIDMILARPESFDGHFGYFATVLDRAAHALESLQKPADTIRLMIPDQTRPVQLHLANYSNFANTRYPALTVAGEDVIDIYLPIELLSNERRNIFFQLLKHELDIVVFGESHITATLLEAMLNQDPGKRILGYPSDRLLYPFDTAHRLLPTLTQERSVYSLHGRASNVIAAEKHIMAAITHAPHLNQSFIDYATQLTEHLTFQAQMLCFEAEDTVASLNGTVRGFKIKAKLGEGEWGNVYLAEHNGHNYALKFFKIRDRSIPYDVSMQYQRHLGEAALTQRMYHDVLFQTIAENHNPFIAIPYSLGYTLETTAIALPADEQERVNIALEIVRAMMQVEACGIMHNDIKPGNLYWMVNERQVRVLDFGLAIERSNIPEAIDELKAGISPQYASPEQKTFIASIDTFVNAFLDLLDTPIDLLTPESLVPFRQLLDIVEQQGGDPNQIAYLRNTVLPKLEARIRAKQIIQIEEISGVIEPLMIRALYSMLDTRSDIYSVGLILNRILFQSIGAPQLADIIVKSIAPKPNRYQSFTELYEDLNRYAASIPVQQQEMHIPEIHFLNPPTLPPADELRTIVAGWQQITFTSGLIKPLQEHLFAARQNHDLMLSEAQKVYQSTDYPAGRWVLRALEVEDDFASQIGLLTDSVTAVSIHISDTGGSYRPLVIHLTTLEDLASLNVSALTIAGEERIDMYLPGAYLVSKDIDTFVQLMKTQLEVYVFGQPYARAVMTESLLNPRSGLRLGSISNRVLYDLERPLQNAVAQNNLTALYEIHDHFKRVLTDSEHIIAQIDRHTELTDAERQCAKDWAKDIAHHAKVLAIETERQIALRNGNIRGFSFLGKLGEGSYGTVFLAYKNGQLWVAKMLNRTKHPIEAINAHFHDFSYTRAIYADLLEEDIGSFDQGENMIIARPFIQGTQLHKIDLSVFTLKERLELALAIAKQFIHIEDLGIVVNDIKPDHILLGPFLSEEVRFFDFGCACYPSAPPKKHENVTVSMTFPYISPEISTFTYVFPNLISQLDDIRALKAEEVKPETFAQLFDQIEYFINNVSQHHTDTELSDYLLNEFLPEWEQRLWMCTDEDLEEFSTLLEPLLLKVLYGVLDHRSDMYALSKVLKNTVLDGIMTPELSEIIDKAMAQNKNDRYPTFRDFHRALEHYTMTVTHTALDNVAFGTIDERDHRRYGGLNTLISELVDDTTTPVEWTEERTAAHQILYSVDFEHMSTDQRLQDVLSKHNIATAKDWTAFVATMREKIENARILTIPADTYLFWVGPRFAAAHFGRYGDRDNIYLPHKFEQLLSTEEKAYILFHETLHLAGLDHTEAELIQAGVPEHAAQYTHLKQFTQIIAQLDRAPAMSAFKQSEVQRFVTLATPIIKQAILHRSALNAESVERIFAKRNFSSELIRTGIRMINTFMKSDRPDSFVNTEPLRPYMPDYPDIPETQIREFIRQLGSPYPLIQAEAIDELLMMGYTVLPHLQDVLRNGTTIAKRNALYIVSINGNAGMLPDIMPLLNDTSERLRREAMDTIVMFSGAPDKKQLETMLATSDNPSEIITALHALNRLGFTLEINTPRFLNHPNTQVREVVHGILEDQGTTISEEQQSTAHVWELIHNLVYIEGTPLFEESIAALRRLGADAVPMLQSATESEIADIRFWSGILLAEQGNHSAIRPLLYAAYHGGPQRRTMVSKLLRQDTFAAGLIDIVRTEDTIYSEQAAAVLGFAQNRTALPAFHVAIANNDSIFSLPTRQAALNAAIQVDGANVAEDLHNTVEAILQHHTITFDDRVMLLEIVHNMHQLKAKKALSFIRRLLHFDSIPIKKAVLTALGDLGTKDDLSSIRISAILYPQVQEEAQSALTKLDTLWNRWREDIGFFVAGYPPAEHLSSDDTIHKNHLSSAEEIIEQAHFRPTKVYTTIAGTTYSLTIKIDTDFLVPVHPVRLTEKDISSVVHSILFKDPQLAQALDGKTIHLALLTHSFRLSENHLADDFIGFNTAIRNIKDRDAFMTLFRALLAHELKHEAHLSPKGALNLMAWENKEFIDTIMSLIRSFHHRSELNNFITAIQPAFEKQSFMVSRIEDIVHGRITPDELSQIASVDLLHPAAAQSADFTASLNTERTKLKQLGIGSLRYRLAEAGILDHDITLLIHMHNVSGGLSLQNTLAEIKIKAAQSIFMEEYARQLFDALVARMDTTPVYEQFIINFKRILKTDTIDSHIAELQKIFSDYTDTRIDDGGDGIKQFMHHIITEYLYSRFSGRESILAEPRTQRAVDAVRQALDATPAFSDMMLSTDAIPGTPAFIETQHAFIEKLSVTAQAMNIPLFIIDRDLQTATRRQIIPKHIGRSLLIEQSL